ncbi:NAD(P)H-binding protein [Paenibacillus assamensis]|nr:NAD(P)H-binding protein [Paenibacillus assamensis]
MKQDIYTIAIIGGTGKVGRVIVKEALSEGYKVRLLARNPE